MDSGYAGGGNEEDGDEAKQMGKTYATMVLPCMLGPFWCRCLWEVQL